ncbi:MAG: methyltransferase domain-containing protein [Candidatus Paceibacterota bacterium]
MNELETKLNTIKNVFDVEAIIKLKSDESYIQKYYKINQTPYTFFYNKDYIHFGISRDGIYKESDLLEQARIIQNIIKENHSTKVLELATGRGSNSFYLSNKFPHTEFYGIDISNAQLTHAYEKTAKVRNFHLKNEDYHNLKSFKSSSFDIVFVIEALCHSEDKNQVVSEVHRVLKPGGFFVIFDGYRNEEEKYSSNELLAMKLIERGLALNKLETYKGFKNIIQKNNFTIIKEEDVSLYLIPSSKRMERLADRYFHRPLLAKLLKIILPKKFLYNIPAGYLMPYAFRERLWVYMITILRK